MVRAIEDFLNSTEADDKAAPAESGFASWEQAKDETAQLGLSVKTAAAKSPESAATILQLRDETGVPEDVVERNVDVLKQQSKDATFSPEKFRLKNPVVSDWMASTPNNAALVQDEVDQVAAIERTVQDYGLFETMYRSLNAGAARLNSSIAQVPAALTNVALLPYNLTLKYGVKRPEFQFQFPTANVVSKYYDQAVDAYAVPEMDASITDEISSGEYSRAGRALAAQFVANAPQQALIIAGVLSGYGGVALAGAGLTTGADVMGRSQEAGADPTQATVNAALQGTIESAFERIGTFGILKTWEARIAKQYGKEVSKKIFADFGKTLAYSFAAEGNEEMMTQAAQDYTDFITGVNPNALKGMGQRMLDAGLVGGFSGGVMTGPSAFGAGAFRASEMRRTQMAKDFYTSLGASVEATKMRERLPEATRQIVNNLTKDSPVEKIYISPEKVDEYFQSKSLDPVKTMQEIGVIKEYTAAKETGSDVEIPLSTWAANVVGTEYYQGLADDIKFSPDDFSVNEQKELSKAMTEQEAVQQDEAAAEEPIKARAAVVNEQVTEKLKAAGFDDQTAASYSKIYEAAFQNLGRRAGVDPVELFQRYGLEIKRPEVMGRTEEQSFSQAAMPKPGEVLFAGYQESSQGAVPLYNVLAEDGIGVDTLYGDETLKKRGMAAPETPTLEEWKAGKKISETTDPLAVEADLAERLALPEAVTAYDSLPDTHGGKVLDTDSARELSPQYAANNEGRTAYTLATQKPATRFVSKRFDEKLAEPGEGNVILLAGGGGSGKNTVLNGALKKSIPGAHVILNAVMADLTKTRARIEAAKASGRKVRYVYVHRPVASAARGMAGRFSETGRWVPTEVLVNDHIQAQETALALAEIYKDDPDVKIEVFDNSGTKPKKSTIEKLRASMYNQNGGDSNATNEKIGGEIQGILAGLQEEIRSVQPGRRRLAGVSGQYGQSGTGAPGERGRIRFGGDRQFSIDLLKNADLSTFLHETGHFYLEVLADLAADKNATPDIKSDYETVLAWFGVKPAAWSKMQADERRKFHEQFARGFEAYLMEGKAPSAALRNTFARFRAWLISIYKQMQSLAVDLTPEVRGVFDRLLASQEEIEQAEAEQNIAPLFADPAAIGMSEEEAARYQKAVAEARQAAVDTLDRKMIEQVAREQKAWWKEERANHRKNVAEAINQQREHVALSVLQHGTLPDGSPLPEGMEPIKLDKKAIQNDFPGDSDWSHLLKMKPHVWAAEGGMHPDQAATIFGYPSGHQMLFDLNSQTETRDEQIDRETDELMKQIHGDIMLDGSLPAEAMKAIHNEARAKLFHMELEHLAKQNLPALKGLVRRVARPIPKIDVVRAQAEQMIAQKRTRDILPSLYQRAEGKAANEAIQAMLKGDFEAAFTAKQRELLNHELFRAASAAVENVDKIVDHMKKLGKPSTRERIGKAGEDYLEQIDAIAARYDFRRAISLKALDKRKSLVAWVQEQNELGYSVDIPPEVLNESRRISYKDVTYEELVGVNDSVQQIEHLARLKNKLLANERARELSVARDEILASIAANHAIKPEPIDFAPDFKKRMVDKVKQTIAAHTRMEFLFEWLDGNKPGGVMWDYFFKPFAEAENAENTAMRGVVKSMNDIFGVYTRKERALWFVNKTFIPEINTAMNKANMLALALNQGNTYNREAVLEGYGWTQDQVDAVLARLDERDWKTVQGLWDYIDTFWPQIAEQERELNGVAPQKVETAEVETKFGTFKGGYYPIVFDSKFSWRQAIIEEKATVQEMFGGHWARAMTRHGHTKERTNTGGKPILLELTGLTNHLASVVHDLTHRKAVIDVSRLAADSTIREAINATAGSEMYKQLNPWLSAIAGDRRGEPANPIEGLLGSARAGATVVNLGWKVTSAMVQTLGYTITVKEIGPKYAAQGLSDAYKDPFKIRENWAFITERSDMMRDRLYNYDRDVRDALKKLNVAGVKQGPFSAVDAYTRDLRDSFFMFVGYMDLGTSIPTWLGAYRKAMDGGLENVEKGNEKAAVLYADQVVRQTQAAGSAKDLASIQRGSEAWRLFTMFYSSLSIIFNQFEKTWNQFRLDRNVPKLMGSAALMWFIPAVLEELLRGRGPGDDEDSEDIAKWFAKQELLYPFQSIVLVRDIIGSLERRNYDGSPAFAAFNSLSKTAKVGLNLAFGDKEEITRADVRDTLNTVGYFAALPTRQVWQTLEYVYDWMTGEETPDNPIEGVWRALVTGKPRD